MVRYPRGVVSTQTRRFSEITRTAAQTRVLDAALLGTEAGVEARLHAAMLSSAISVAVMHPLIADVDDETLRAQLLHMTRRMLDLRE